MKSLYREFTAKGVDVLYDDTDQRAGAKFAAADLIGIPWQILVGPKGLAEGKVEIKRRSDGARENLEPGRSAGKADLVMNYPPLLTGYQPPRLTISPNRVKIDLWMKP